MEIKKILEDCWDNIRSKGRCKFYLVDDEEFVVYLVSRLKSLFGTACLMKALEIIDLEMIVKVETVDSKRSFFIVQGLQQRVYHILWPGIFCPCQSFSQSLQKYDSYFVHPT